MSRLIKDRSKIIATVNARKLDLEALDTSWSLLSLNADASDFKITANNF